MTRRVVNEYVPDVVSPPGGTLSEVIDALGMSQTELASRMGRPVKTINEIINGKASITPETSLQLESVLGMPASFWQNRENRYREYLAREAEKARLEADVAWLKRMPVSALVSAGWIEGSQDKIELTKTLLSFFGVASSEAWSQVWTSPQATFRASRVFEAEPGAVAAWLRKGELEAQRIECKQFDLKALRETLDALRRLTTDGPGVFVPRLQQLCADCGVAVVFVPELPKSRVSGATWWLNPSKALVQLSLRYKTDDHLWFTFFHELGHIILHSKRRGFLEGGDVASEDSERQADQFAADTLIPAAHYRRFLASAGRISMQMVEQFAHQLEIAPGIVVGRLQHDCKIPFTHLNGLKRRFEWAAKV